MTTATKTACRRDAGRRSSEERQQIDREAAMMELLPYIQRMAQREVFRGCPIPVEDLVQIAAVEIWKSLHRFDPDRGFKLITWAALRIKGAMKDAMRNGRMTKGGTRTGRTEKIFDVNARRDNGSYVFDHTDERSANDAERKAAEESFNDLLRGLTKVERLIVVLYFRDGMLMREIGESLGICEARVSQITTRILAMLKQRMQRASA
jgi:RNA polymerase sigma factor (sigma-70 family)